jgi:hypothetical protein
MIKRWRHLAGLFLLATMALLAGCAPGGAYRGPETAGPASRDLPPALRDTPSSLWHWYSPPYFDPYEMP